MRNIFAPLKADHAREYISSRNFSISAQESTNHVSRVLRRTACGLHSVCQNDLSVFQGVVAETLEMRLKAAESRVNGRCVFVNGPQGLHFSDEGYIGTMASTTPYEEQALRSLQRHTVHGKLMFQLTSSLKNEKSLAPLKSDFNYANVLWLGIPRELQKVRGQIQIVVQGLEPGLGTLQFVAWPSGFLDVDSILHWLNVALKLLPSAVVAVVAKGFSPFARGAVCKTASWHFAGHTLA